MHRPVSPPLLLTRPLKGSQKWKPPNMNPLLHWGWDLLGGSIFLHGLGGLGYYSLQCVAFDVLGSCFSLLCSLSLALALALYLPLYLSPSLSLSRSLPLFLRASPSPPISSSPASISDLPSVAFASIMQKTQRRVVKKRGMR